MFCLLAGLTSEGLYRVAGFHDDVEAIKMAFDKGVVTWFVSIFNSMQHVTMLCLPQSAGHYFNVTGRVNLINGSIQSIGVCDYSYVAHCTS